MSQESLIGSGGALEEFVALEKESKVIDMRLKWIKKRTAELSEIILEYFTEKHIKNINIQGMVVYMHSQLWAFARPGMKNECIAVLKELGMDEYVGEAFSPQAISAWVREALAGKIDNITSLPESFRRVFDVTERYDVRARLAQ